MHYFIDGYNLLFRSHTIEESLQESRVAIIRDLNQKVAIARLNVSIVFDSSFQIEETKTHFDQIEIFYTSKGKTADEYILEQIKNSLYPRRETVVTSDKGLARHVRAYQAETQTVEAFLEWLNRVYANRLDESIHAVKTEKKPTIAKPKMVQPPKKDASASCEEYYAHVFESQWNAFLAREESEKRTKAPQLEGKANKKKPRKRRLHPPLDENMLCATDEERWLKIFEKRWDDLHA